MDKVIVRLAISAGASVAALLLLSFLSVHATEANALQQGQGSGSSGSPVAAVEKALHDAQSIDGRMISVAEKNGTIVLSGEVDDLLTHDRALRIAASVEGVRAIDDKLTVRPNGQTDELIERDVATAIAVDPAMEFWEIDATVMDGVVTLRGSVNSYAEKSLAAKVAKGVSGVRSVINEITIDHAVERTDRQIAQDVTQVLRWNTTVNSSSIDIEVDNAVVTLSGEVDSLYEKKQAVRLSRVVGVKDVRVADLAVRQPDGKRREDAAGLEDLTDIEIATAVRTALARNPRIAGCEPLVEVDGGIVTLGGVVANVEAKRAAAEAAGSTLGVTEVRNRMTVNQSASGCITRSPVSVS